MWRLVATAIVAALMTLAASSFGWVREDVETNKKDIGVLKSADAVTEERYTHILRELDELKVLVTKAHEN